MNMGPSVSSHSYRRWNDRVKLQFTVRKVVRILVAETGIVKETVVLLTSDGKEFVIAEADDFDQEVSALRNSQTFQRFLAERSQSIGRIPLEEIEAEVERELAAKRKAT